MGSSERSRNHGHAIYRRAQQESEQHGSAARHIQADRHEKSDGDDAKAGPGQQLGNRGERAVNGIEHSRVKQTSEEDGDKRERAGDEHGHPAGEKLPQLPSRRGPDQQCCGNRGK